MFDKRKGEEYHPHLMRATVTHGEESIMVWACKYPIN